MGSVLGLITFKSVQFSDRRHLYTRIQILNSIEQASDTYFVGLLDDDDVDEREIPASREHGLHGLAPAYYVTNSVDQQTLKPDDDYVLPHQRLWTFDVLVCPLSTIERFLLQPLVCGTVFHRTSLLPHLSLSLHLLLSS